jgi:hypothetical protein
MRRNSIPWARYLSIERRERSARPSGSVAKFTCVLALSMDSDGRPHKPHRPAHSSTKAAKKNLQGQEKPSTFNDKVCPAYRISHYPLLDRLRRRLLRHLVEEPTAKDVEMLRKIKIACMYPSLIVPQMIPPLPWSLRLLALPVLGKPLY